MRKKPKLEPTKPAKPAKPAKSPAKPAKPAKSPAKPAKPVKAAGRTKLTKAMKRKRAAKAMGFAKVPKPTKAKARPKMKVPNPKSKSLRRLALKKILETSPGTTPEERSSGRVRDMVVALGGDPSSMASSSRSKFENMENARRRFRGRGEENTTVIEGDDGITYIFESE